MDFIDLKSQQERIRKKIDDRIQLVLNHGRYIMGPEVYELEEGLQNTLVLNSVFLVHQEQMLC